MARREDPFARIPHTVLEDERLSWKAKGILSYLIGKPAGWKMRVTDLQNRGTDGKSAVRAALDELRACGYAEFVQDRTKLGTFNQGVWKISDTPIFKPRTDFPEADKPDAGNRDNSKKELSKNEFRKNQSEELKKTEETAEVSAERGAEKFIPKGIFDSRTKSEKLAEIERPKRGQYPTQREFDAFIESEELDEILSGKRDQDGIYHALVRDKWRQWKNEHWVKIRDWKAYVRGLNDRIADATGGF